VVEFNRRIRPHKDLLHPDETQSREDFRGYSVEDVMALGERDIKSNWRKYRATFEKEAKS
jgi:hypothetical protein